MLRIHLVGYVHLLSFVRFLLFVCCCVVCQLTMLGFAFSRKRDPLSGFDPAKNGESARLCGVLVMRKYTVSYFFFVKLTSVLV